MHGGVLAREASPGGLLGPIPAVAGRAPCRAYSAAMSLQATLSVGCDLRLRRFARALAPARRAPDSRGLCGARSLPERD